MNQNPKIMNQLTEKQIFLKAYWEKSSKTEIDALYIIKACKIEPKIDIKELIKIKSN